MIITKTELIVKETAEVTEKVKADIKNVVEKDIKELIELDNTRRNDGEGGNGHNRQDSKEVG